MENEGSGWKQRYIEILPKTNDRFIDVCRNEVEELKSVKIQFGLLVRFRIDRNGEVEHMEHNFNRMQPIVLNHHQELNPSQESAGMSVTYHANYIRVTKLCQQRRKAN